MGRRPRRRRPRPRRPQLGPPSNHPRRREYSRPRDNRPANATYGDRVSAAPDPIPLSVAKARFAIWVKRMLATARDRGETDPSIQKLTGISPSTFHRWQQAKGQKLPELEKVKAFARGLGGSAEEAMRALGVDDKRPSPEPEPPLPPEIRTILRALADPNVSPGNKLIIREMLYMLAERAAGSSSRWRESEPPDETAD